MALVPELGGLAAAAEPLFLGGSAAQPAQGSQLVGMADAGIQAAGPSGLLEF